jgi:hypothetical protein
VRLSEHDAIARRRVCVVVIVCPFLLNCICFIEPRLVVIQEDPQQLPCNGTPSECAAGGDATVEADHAGEGSDVVLKSRKPASRVWNFFSPRYHSSKDQRVCVKCKLCDLELTYANTTNMHNHLVRKHGSDYLQDLATGAKVSEVVFFSINSFATNYLIARRSRLPRRFWLALRVKMAKSTFKIQPSPLCQLLERKSLTKSLRSGS